MIPSARSAGVGRVPRTRKGKNPVSPASSLLLLPLLVGFTAPLRADVALPTPRGHYEHYDVEAEAPRLLLEAMAGLPGASRARAYGLLQAYREGGHRFTPVEVRFLLEAAGWDRRRPELLDLFLHASRVLDVVPEGAEDWLPIVHDSLLLFLDRLDERRLIERIVAEMNLPRDASRGDRVLAFIARTPSLQKLAQMLARNPAVAPDIRGALQTVENGLSTQRYEDVMARLRDELGEDVIARDRIEFSDHLLAEASVGAVMEATFTPPGTSVRKRAACKVLKPDAVAAMKKDLEIFDLVLANLEENGGFYGIGKTPLIDIFEDLREAFSREVRVEDEQENLRRAAEFYRDDPRVKIPEIYPFSTPRITCMEYIEGEKITEAFPGRPADRARLARRLSDALTYDVLFSPRETAVLHGDPHAGNVFHVTGNADDPYRVALLDWGLSAGFSRGDREKMVQLLLGLYLKDSKRLANHIDALVDWTPASEADARRMRDRVDRLISEAGDRGMFELLDELITGLAREGYSVRFATTMFIKSQLTIAGILHELDPAFAQDDYVMGRITGQVVRELHVRLLRTLWFPAWNSHHYRSLMSNEDVKDVEVHRLLRGLRWVGRAVESGVSFRWLRCPGDRMCLGARPVPLALSPSSG